MTYVNPFLHAPLPMDRALSEAGFTEKQVPLSTVTLNYVEGPANGTPLLLLPAQMGIWRSYYKVLPTLSQHFHVFSVDIRGHGNSTWTPRDYTWSSISGDIIEFIEKVIGRPTILSGNSSGGIIALYCGAHAPQWTKAVILEDAPVFSTEMPRFRDRDRFNYRGIQHAVEVLENFETRDLANYYAGQVMPINERRVKRMPHWFIRWLSRKLKDTERRNPGTPIAFDQWYIPRILQLQFTSLKMYDPDFGRAFVDGRIYEDFSHEAAFLALRCPLFIMHANWMRLPDYGLVGAMDDDDAQHILSLVPHAKYQKFRAKHVIHMFAASAFSEAVVGFAREIS
ncbi:MAG: alpha/beta hydrolase [Actinomycetaceae bacterium]|nr:alpha/beta hydrolase [Actinomycetaceae bacterium]